MERKRTRRRFFYCLLSVCVLLNILSIRTLYFDRFSSAVEKNGSYLQGIEKTSERKEEEDLNLMMRTRKTRNGFGTMRHLSGLGSYPPRCTAKCGKCTPCKPVHVPVPPGTSAPTEYYPEAWRCKCGNKLYMP